MNNHTRILRIKFLILITALFLFIFSSLQADKAELLENSAMCLDCHEDMDQSLMLSSHRLLSEGDLSSTVAVGCTSCHDGWQEHIEDPSVDNIISGREIGGLEQAQICARCHQEPHQAAMITDDPHARNGLNCSDCHQVHNNNSMNLVKDDKQEFCLDCHLNVAAQFKSRSTHPLESGNITCTDCHDLSGIENPDLAVGLDWKCQECHLSESGPFVYEHPVTYSHLVDGSGCTECHNPHGAPNDRLLKQAGNGTCNQCHSAPAGHRQAHNGIGTRYACNECHTEVHGSDHNSKFLDPDLGSKTVVDCYQSGCHSIGN